MTKVSQMLVNILVTDMMPIFTQASENISQTLFIIFSIMLKGAFWKDYITLSSYIRLIFFEGLNYYWYNMYDKWYNILQQISLWSSNKQYKSFLSHKFILTVKQQNKNSIIQNVATFKWHKI